MSSALKKKTLMLKDQKVFSDKRNYKFKFKLVIINSG